jgi:Rrf2 family protein
MKAQGWVDSAAGKRGGYFLAKSPEKITMGQVVRFFEEALAPINCVSVSHYERCSQEPVCRFRRVLLDIRNATSRAMDQATLAAVMAGQPVTRQEVFAPEFMAGAGI